MFSPKVLERANVIEFNDADLKQYAGGTQVPRSQTVTSSVGFVDQTVCM